jgi:hypothetical protein
MQLEIPGRLLEFRTPGLPTLPRPVMNAAAMRMSPRRAPMRNRDGAWPDARMALANDARG